MSIQQQPEIVRDLNFSHLTDSDGDTRISVICPRSMNVIWTRWFSKREQEANSVNTMRVIEIAWDCLRREGGTVTKVEKSLKTEGVKV